MIDTQRVIKYYVTMQQIRGIMMQEPQQISESLFLQRIALNTY